MVSPTDIEVRDLPGQTIAYQCFQGTLPSIESATSSVRSWVVTMGYKPQGPVAVEIEGRPWEDPGADYSVEVQLPVEERAKAHPTDHVQIKRFEPTRAVVMTLHGPCELAHLGEPLQHLAAWMREHNYEDRDAGKVRWVEITDPTKVATEDQVTEIQELIRA